MGVTKVFCNNNGEIILSQFVRISDLDSMSSDALSTLAHRENVWDNLREALADLLLLD